LAVLKNILRDSVH